MFEFRLALKNLWRHRRRTVLTAVVVAFGVLLFSAFDSLLSGFEEDSLRNLVRYESGVATVHAKGYWAEREDHRLDRVIPGAEAVAARLRQVPGVRDATPELVFSAAVNTGVEETPVTATGIDPEHDPGVLDLKGAVRAGRYLRPGQPEALLGRELARLMELKVGDTFTLILRTERSTFEALDLEVAGLLGSNSPAVNDGVFLPLDVAQSAANLPGGATHILVGSDRYFRSLGSLPADVRQTVSAVSPDLEVKSWQDWSGIYLLHAQSDRQNMSFILAIVALLAGLGVANNILLAGLERRREIGALKALGMTEGQITRLFMLEGMGIGLIGGLIGAVLGVGAVAYLVNVGVDYTKIQSGYDFGFAVEGLMRGAWNWATILGALVVGTALSFGVSYWPARRSARLDPAAVLRS